MNYNVYAHKDKNTGVPADLLRVEKETINYEQKGGNINSHLDGIDTKLGENEAAITAVAEGDFVLSNSAPTAADSTGIAGQVAYDSSYIYICVDTDTWVRAAIATWSE